MMMNQIDQEFAGRTVTVRQYPRLVPLYQKILAQYSPIAVLLYGSRARGTPHESSDWDLKIVVADDSPDEVLSPLFGWKVQEGSGVYADLSCVRISDFIGDIAVANSAAREVVRDGVRLGAI